MTADDVMADAVKAAAEVIRLGLCEWHGMEPYANCDTCASLANLRQAAARDAVAAAAPILLAPIQAEVTEARNAFSFFRTTHTCFTDEALLAYRIRQREHGARVAVAAERRRIAAAIRAEASGSDIYAEWDAALMHAARIAEGDA